MRSFRVFIFAAVTCAVANITMAELLDFILLHTNDMHSHFDEMDAYCNECREEEVKNNKCYGGFARVAYTVKREKEKAAANGMESLFLVAGDTYQGTPYFSFFKWKPVVDFINQLKPDVTTLGNHEFDAGIANLLPYLNHTISIPMVVSNLDLTKEPELKKYIQKSIIKTINGTKVGFVGYLTPDTKFLSQPDVVEFIDEIEALKRETKLLLKQGTKIIIALGHSGIEKDIEVAKQVGDIDVIVGGHSHTFLYSGKQPDIDKPRGPYPTRVNSTNGKMIPVLQAYAHTKYVGKVHLKFDSNGNLLHIDGSPILMDHTIPKDDEMEKIMNIWRPQIIEKTAVRIGRTEVELINTCISTECNIGNLIADAYVYNNVLSTNQSGKYWSDAPIGLLQAGGVRSSINETGHNGYISMGQLITVLPFMNKLVKLTIPGKNVLEAFESSVYYYKENQGTDRFLQVSGAIVKYDLSRPPGNRVVSLLLRCKECRVPKYEPVKHDANYTLLMCDYLAMGGDNFTSFTHNVMTYERTDIVDYNAVAVYMNTTSPLIIGIENRISFSNNNDTNKSSAHNNYTIVIKLLILSIIIVLANQ
ncbi:protein 5NUC-like [Daktulosphaira vitifoliae]|uniref:protein 5NUC-like n=1 Tax=Daktulosphaira vitifoliae TaxID=58002 RepID=UPI0021A9E5CE|nr:protein 5NUC-like [Daktulosphaira vitifoliae]